MGDWRPGAIPGVLRRTLTIHPDDRGSFAELWRSSWTDGLEGEMRQANLSRSRPGVLRGLHVHRRQADLWIVVDGHPFVALVDVRPVLAGTGEPAVETFDADPGDAVYLPAGVAHGFHAPDAITLFYVVTNEHDGSDELGFAWDDPAVGVPWPVGEPILSGRDATAPSLAELVRSLRS